MKKIYFLNLLLVLFIALNFAGCKKTDANKEEVKIKYHPATKEELKALVDNESINLGEIDTSKITDMSKLFYDNKRQNFKGIENWDVSNVKDMSGMFWRATWFKGNLNNWNVSNVDNMSRMFRGTSTFDSHLNNWNVSNVKDMSGMFMAAKVFDGDISNWNVSNVKDMSVMFQEASAFNQDISNWNVSNVENMTGMFSRAESFNQNLDNWNVEKVEAPDMNFMFVSSPMEHNKPVWFFDGEMTEKMYAISMEDGIFYPSTKEELELLLKNPKLSLDEINTSKITDMSELFMHIKRSNFKGIGSWDVSNVTNMRSMFWGAESFNEDISSWNVSRLKI